MYYSKLEIFPFRGQDGEQGDEKAIQDEKATQEENLMEIFAVEKVHDNITT